MRKNVFVLVSILLICVHIFAVKLLNPLGPALIPVVPILEKKVPSDVEVVIWRNPEEAIARLVSGEADFAVLPITTAANLYTRGIKISLVAVHEWKVFYLVVAKDVVFEGWKSLKGKEVYTPHGRGQTVDVLMRYFLVREGLKPDEDVKVLYAPPQEIVVLFKTGKVKFAALPEPYATMCLDNGYLALDFQKEWGKVMNLPERLPIAGLFVRKGVGEDEVERIENVLKNSMEWMFKNLEATLSLAEKHLGVSKDVLMDAFERMGFQYVPVELCREEVATFLQKMNELYPEGMPQVPDAGFYGR